MGSTPLPSVVRRVVSRPAALSLLTLAFVLTAAPAARAAEVQHVLHYDLFVDRPFGNNGEDIQAAAASDGQALVVWTEWDTATSVQTSYGQWLAPDGTPSGETFRVASRASVTKVAVAPGRRAIAVVHDQVALAYTDAAGSPLFARWITPRRSGPVVVVDPSTDVGLFAPSVTHLRDRVFAVSWLAEWASGTDGEDYWRSTTVQEATFRAPDVVRAERKFSPPSAGIHPGPVSEHREPFVVRNGDREQLVGWFGCEYGSSPGGRLCFDRNGLYLRARRNGGPSGLVIGLRFVSPFARVVHTGDLLLTITLFQKALDEDLWSLQVQGWEIE